MSDDADLPPHDILAEQGVLGGMLTAVANVTVANDMLVAGDFYRPAHAATFSAILGLSEAGVQADVTTVLDALHRSGDPDGRGGELDIAALAADGVETTPSATAHYARIVAAHSVSRSVQRAGLRLAALAQSGRTDPVALMEAARTAVDAVTDRHRHRDSHRGVILTEAIAARLDDYRQPTPPGLPTGWPEIDQALGPGLRPGSLTIVGASTGTGKSLFAIALAVSAARRGVGSVLASVEMARDEITDRVLSDLAGIDSLALASHHITELQWPRLAQAAHRLRDAPLWIEDTPGLSVTRLRSVARDQQRRPGGLGLIVADYLQLMRPADERIPRQEQVASISRALKDLAGDFRIPVVAAAQLNREATKRVDNRPRKSDLRESGALEHDSAYIILLHRDANNPHELLIDLAKNRFGPETTALVPIQPKYSRIGRHLEAI